MKEFLQLALEAFFALLILGCVIILLFATVADLFGWYDHRGKYNGPFSKHRKK